MMVARKELLKREPGARARATVGTPTPALFLFSLFQTIIAPAELSRVEHANLLRDFRMLSLRGCGVHRE